MSKENTFLIFVVEYYRNRKNLSGSEVITLFDKHNVWELAKKSGVAAILGSGYATIGKIGVL